MIPITEIHPMLVHFPIVFWISAETIAVVILLGGGDLSNRQQWPMAAFHNLLAGVVFAILAARFGDIALDHVLVAGFAPGPLKTHETAALATIFMFGLHALLGQLAVWGRLPLWGLRGWLAELPGVFGIGGLLVTAQLGGGRVYHLGANAAAAVH